MVLTALGSALTVGSLALVRYLLGWHLNRYSLCMFAISGLVLYFSIWYVLPHGRITLRLYKKIAVEILKKKIR
jgi:hypothetical protein